MSRLQSLPFRGPAVMFTCIMSLNIFIDVTVKTVHVVLKVMASYWADLWVFWPCPCACSGAGHYEAGPGPYVSQIQRHFKPGPGNQGNCGDLHYRWKAAMWRQPQQQDHRRWLAEQIPSHSVGEYLKQFQPSLAAPLTSLDSSHRGAAHGYCHQLLDIHVW